MDVFEQARQWRKLHPKIVYCGICGYPYAEEDGDPEQGIPPGTLAEDLPREYYCQGCGAPLWQVYV